MLVLYDGDAERGAGHIASLRALGPALDAVQPMPYCALQTMLDPPGESPDARAYYRFSSSTS